jgi:hypothetical protein
VLVLPAGFRVGDFLYLADDDQEAEAVSGAPVALLPGDPALFCAKAMRSTSGGFAAQMDSIGYIADMPVAASLTSFRRVPDFRADRRRGWANRQYLSQ